ncbi:hypothetical protein GX441_07190 [bacterium]|nr:hypothetical protein [bacterium]
MKRILTVLLVTALLYIPLSLSAQAKGGGKIHPMMMGPKLSSTVLPVSGILNPLTVSGEMLINLYRNVLWLRTNLVSLSIRDSSNYFGINLGSPFDIVFMGRYKQWRPYGFGGLGVSVNSFGENTSYWAGVDLGGGASYEISRGLHLFGELGGRLGYNGTAFDYGIFLGAGARFAFVW